MTLIYWFLESISLSSVDLSNLPPCLAVQDRRDSLRSVTSLHMSDKLHTNGLLFKMFMEQLQTIHDRELHITGEQCYALTEHIMGLL